MAAAKLSRNVAAFVKRPGRETLERMLKHIHASPVMEFSEVHQALDAVNLQDDSYRGAHHFVMHALAERLVRTPTLNLNTRQKKLIRAVFQAQTEHNLHQALMNPGGEIELAPFQQSEARLNKANLELSKDPQLDEILKRAEAFESQWTSQSQAKPETDSAASNIQDGSKKFATIFRYVAGLRQLQTVK